jgi:hypothetical protein
MDANAHFCTKCGKSVTPAASAPAAAAPAQSYTPPAQSYTPPAQTYTPPPSSGGSNVGKILLIVGGVLVVLFVFFVGGAIYVAHRVKNRIRDGIRVSQNGRDSVVETPFGRVATSQSDAKTLARQIGVDLYPGATPGESSTAQFGKMTTTSIKFTTSDSVDRVASYYQSKFPNGMLTKQGDQFSLLVSGTKMKGTLTIQGRNADGTTTVDIARIDGIDIPNLNH